jgi:hypothetical protein
MPHDSDGGQPADVMIDDLMHDILGDAGQAAAGSFRPQLPGDAPPLERVLLAEAVAGALADALAPALADALAPRILRLTEGEEPGQQAERAPARPAKSAGK